jgi:lysozyme
MDVAKLRASLIAHEGNVPYVYDDATGKPIVSGCTVVGNPTVGVGRLVSSAKGLSPAECGALLDNDIASCIAEASAWPWWAPVANDDVRGRAIVEILFNLGLPKLNGFVVALAALGNGDFEGAASAFRDSAWFNQVGSQPGQRGYVLTEMIETGVDPAQ